jgi:hypothetical protein
MSPADTARTCCCWRLLAARKALAAAPQQGLVLLQAQLALVVLLPQPGRLVMLQLLTPAAPECAQATAVPAAWVMLVAAAAAAAPLA